MPIDPSYLSELFMLIAALVVGTVALNRLFTRRWLRALQLGAISAALVAVAIFMGTETQWPSRRASQTDPGRLLVPMVQADTLPQEPGAPPRMSLLLGGVQVETVLSDKYVLSANGEEFLTIDSLPSGIRVTCDVAGPSDPPYDTPRLAAQLRGNVFTFVGGGVITSKPDPCTLLVRVKDTDALRVRYIDPRRIDVEGQFYLSEGKEPRLAVFEDGIRWSGGDIARGSGGVDLRPQGKGRIEFTPPGAIQVALR
ncbi:MAG: hypothetical protein ACRENN_06475 [Candidatus Eiseniibacteriota bacterium]